MRARMTPLADPRLRLHGGQKLDGTGFYQMGARRYDPYIDQLLQPDTIVPELAEPQGLNGYSYVLSNPLRYTDPTGRMECDASCGLDVDGNGDYGGGSPILSHTSPDTLVRLPTIAPISTLGFSWAPPTQTPSGPFVAPGPTFLVYRLPADTAPAQGKDFRGHRIRPRPAGCPLGPVARDRRAQPVTLRRHF